MKKITAFFLSLLFLITSVGINGSIHFCGGKPVKISLLAEHKSCCGNKAKAMRCCRNESFSVKLQDDFVNDPRNQTVSGKSIELLNAYSNELLHVALYAQSIPSEKTFFHPPGRSAPLFELNQVFRL